MDNDTKQQAETLSSRSDLERVVRSTSVGAGLRVQILLALGLTFVLAVVLLTIATAGLARRAIANEREDVARQVAHMVLSHRAESVEEMRGMVSSITAMSAISGVLVVEAEEVRLAHGTTGMSPSVTVRGERRAVTVYMATEDLSAAGALPRLVLIYISMTAALILLLTFILLTRLIVRPIDALTRASERLTKGTAARVELGGASEIARLGASFNRMQRHLMDERQTLRDRLAELERTTQELRDTQESLIRSEKLASIGRLAAGVAHEIGNPLAAMLGMVELVKGGDLSESEEREFLARIESEINRVNAIIRELLDFARPQKDAGLESCDVSDVVIDTFRLLEFEQAFRGVSLVRDIRDVSMIRASPAKVTQVVLNLLLNAVDAIEGHGTIRLDVVQEDDEVRLRVIDDGPGIDLALMNQIFEPFVTSKPPGKGTGLGLAVTHALVEGMGARIEASNLPGSGACFTVWFQRADAGELRSS